MKRSLLILAAGCAAALSTHAAGVVEVKFAPDHGWADAGRTAMQIERTQAAIGGHLKALAAGLPDGQTLEIVVTDIDLAGELRPTRRGDETRVVNGRIDWPRISLRYTLTAEGRTLQQGEETVADMNYFGSLPRRAAYAELPYEKQMLDRWFAQRFTNPH